VTPLHHAATQDHKKIAELLIAKGADVNAKFTKGPLQGWTPLDFATLSAAGNNKEIADLLRKHGGKHGTIYVAAQGGDIEAVKEFLASGTDVNVKDEDGDTPLLEASGGGHKEVVELLIAAGADVNAKSVYGITPLHYAARHDHKETIELLIANGANVNAKVLSGQQQGKTPLDAANEANHTETADLLRKHGSKTGEELKAEC